MPSAKTQEGDDSRSSDLKFVRFAKKCRLRIVLNVTWQPGYNLKNVFGHDLELKKAEDIFSSTTWPSL